MSFCEIFKAFIFTEHFLATASEIYICNVDEELHKKVATIPSFPKMTPQWTGRNSQACVIFYLEEIRIGARFIRYVFGVFFTLVNKPKCYILGAASFSSLLTIISLFLKETWFLFQNKQMLIQTKFKTNVTNLLCLPTLFS